MALCCAAASRAALVDHKPSLGWCSKSDQALRRRGESVAASSSRFVNLGGGRLTGSHISKNRNIATA